LGSGWIVTVSFVSAQLHGDVTAPVDLWNMFCEEICANLPHRMEQQMINIPPEMEAPHIDYGLYLLSQDLHRYEKILTDFLLSNLPYNGRLMPEIL